MRSIQPHQKVCHLPLGDRQRQGPAILLPEIDAEG